MSFVTGRYPIKMDPRDEGWRRMPFDMLPIVRYTGQACLSPPNCERFVLSDARITGANTAPFGNLSFDKCRTSDRVLYCLTDRATYLSLPPPLSRPHLVIATSFAFLICKYLLAHVCHVIAKGRIPNELPNALYWVANPQLIFLREKLAILVS